MTRIALGIESDAAGEFPTRLNKRERKVLDTLRKETNITDTFEQAFVVSNIDNADGSAYTGATGEEVGFSTGRNSFECHQAAVNAAAVVTPFQSADGLEVKPVAGADALEVGNGISSKSKAAYVVGSLPSSSPVFFEAVIKIDDISDVTELGFGFRKAEAYQAAVDNYDEMASFNIGQDADGQIEIHTILNGAATAETDTTETDWADTEEKTLRIEVANDGTCTFSIDGSAPTITASFTFDSGEVIVPFLFLDTETGDPGVSVSSWEVGSK